jgi:hypothetical protein
MSGDFDDCLLLCFGIALTVMGIVGLRSKWGPNFDFSRLEREGVPSRAATALHAMAAGAPVGGLWVISTTPWVLETSVGPIAALALLVVMLVLVVSLGLFLRPRWLVPPALRGRPSLASTVFRRRR